MSGSSDASSSSSAGIGFWGALAILFIALKLTGFIDWAWLWVLAPIWAPLALLVSVVAIYFAVVVAWAAVSRLLNVGGKAHVK